MTNTKNSYPPMAELLPHKGNMVFLDSVLTSGEESISCMVSTKSALIPRNPDGTIPIWVAIEFLAQTVASYAGLLAYRSGERLALGFLVGFKKFECYSHTIPENIQLVSKATKLLLEQFLGIFDCVLEADGKVLVRTQLKVYSPQDVEAYARATHEEQEK